MIHDSPAEEEEEVADQDVTLTPSELVLLKLRP